MIEELKIAVSVLIVLLGGFFALTQIRANNITNARLKWFETLRSQLTDFLSASYDLQLQEGLSTGIEERRGLANIAPETEAYLQKIRETTVERLVKLEQRYSMLLLQLNPKEPLHNKLEGLVTQFIHLHNKIPAAKTSLNYTKLTRTLEAYSDTILLVSRYLLKIEWEKTKRSGFKKYLYMKFGAGGRLLREAIEMPLKPERQSADPT